MSNSATAESANVASSFHALKNGLFGTLFVAQKKQTPHGLQSVAGMCVKFLQLIAFLFLSSEFRWEKDTIAPIKVLSLIPSPAGWFKVVDTVGNNIIFFISLAWVVIFVGLMTWALRNFLKGEIPHLWPLHLLSAIGSFSATIAYIPLVTILLSVFMCDTHNPDDLWHRSYKCYEGAHLALVVISAVFSTVFIALASLFALVFYDSHPLSSSMAAKVHGRADVVVIIVKTLLIFTIEIFPKSMGTSWTLVAINIIAAAAWVIVTFMYMPMTHHVMNALQLALSCTYLWGGICLVIAQAAPSVDAAIILYVGAPTAIMAGVGLAGFRRHQITNMSISKMLSAYEVEMRARFMLQRALNTLLDHSTLVAAKIESGGGEMNDDESVVVKPGMASPRGGRSPRPSISRSPRGSSGGKDRSSSAPKDLKSRRTAMDETAEIGLFAASYKSMETEARAVLLRDRMPATTVNEVEALYKAAVIRFPTSAILHMFQSRFYSTFTEEKHLSTSHLLLANRLNPALDVAFLAYQSRRAAESGAGGGVLSSAMHRVSFDKHLADARTSTMKAAQAQVAFWQELADVKPDINLLHQIATELANHTTWAEDHFKEVFALHPQSLSAMRLFAQYNLSVANNPEKAAAISAEADRIEDQKNREQSNNGSASGSQFVFLDETSMESMADAPAMITIGATSRDLGTMFSVNAAACKILGYTRLQLERRNIQVVIPSPFSDLHDSYMRRYLSTGEGRILETARVALAKHRQGHLIPVVSMTRETTLPDGTPVFTAALRNLNFSDHLVMMDEGWVIQGGTAGALMGLGVEPATLSTSEVSMADYCSTLADPTAVHDLLNKPMGDVVTIRLPGMAEPEAGENESVANGSKQPINDHSQSFRRPGTNGSGSNMEIQHVKATLSTAVIRGFTINILTWRMLSQNEASQRRNSIFARTSFHNGSTNEGGSFKGAMSAKVVVPQPRRRNGAGGAGQSTGEGSMARGVSFSESQDVVVRVEDEEDGNHDQDSTRGEEDGDEASTSRFYEAGAGRGDRDSGSELDSRDAGSQQGAWNDSPKSDAGKATRGSARGTEDYDTANPMARTNGSAAMPSGHPALTAAQLVGGSCPVVNNKSKDGQDGQSKPSRPSATVSEDGTADLNGTRRGSVGDGDGTRSVGKTSSHGSSSKRSSVGRATLNKLRRILADTRGANATKGVPGLTALFITGWSLFLLNLTLGIMSAALLDQNFAKYADNLKFASIAGRTTQAQVRAMRLVTQRALYNRGWLASTREREMQYSKEMADMADYYSTASSRMYELVANTERVSFFTDPILEYADFTDIVPEPAGRVTEYAMKAMLLGSVYWPRSLSTGEVLVGRRRLTTLLDFSSMWAGMLKQYSNLPIENCTNDHPWTLFIATNTQAGAPAHVKIKKAIYESYLASEDSQKTVNTLVLWIFVAMGPVLAAIILMIVIPILLFIDRSRDDIMERFLDLPNLLVSVLRMQADKRLKALRSDDDGGESDNEDEEDGVKNGMEISAGDQSIGEIENADGTVDWDALFVRATVQANREEKKRKAILSQANVRGAHTIVAALGSEAQLNSSAVGAPLLASKAAAGRKQRAGCCSRKPAAVPTIYPNRTFCSRGKRAHGGGYFRSVINPDGTITNFVRRDFKKSAKSMMSLSVFLLPVMLMFLFYLVLYIVTLDTLDRVIAMSAFTSLSALRGAALEASVAALFNMISQTGYGPEEAFRYEFTAQEVVNLRSINELMVYDIRITSEANTDNGIEPPMSYKKGPGTETSTVPGMDIDQMKVITNAMLKNGCKFVAMSGEGQSDEAKCAAFNGGVVTSGLQSALRDYINRNRRLRDRRWATDLGANSSDGIGTRLVATSTGWRTDISGFTVRDTTEGITTSSTGGIYTQQALFGAKESIAAGGHSGTISLKDPVFNISSSYMVPYDLKAELLSDDWTVSDTVVRDYLAPAFLLAAQWYSDAGEGIVTEYRTFLMAFVAAFLTLFSAGIFLLYLPSITILARDVQSKRAMLLLLPAQVTAKVPSIRAMVIQIVAEHEGGGSSSSMANAGRSFAGEEEGGHAPGPAQPAAAGAGTSA